MKVAGKFLIIGPRIHIGKNAVRNVHLIDPDRGATMCGRTPKMTSNTPLGKRWIKMENKDECKSVLHECPNCKHFTENFAVGETLESLR